METLISIRDRFVSIRHDILHEELVGENPEDDYIKNACPVRTRTDVPVLVFHGICLLALMPFLAYCMSNGDIRRLYVREINTEDGESSISFYKNIKKDLDACSGEIVGLCFIALGFACAMLFILRYMVGVFVWLVIIGSVLAMAAAAGSFWMLTDVTLAIVFSILTVVLFLIILVLRRRIELVIQLLKEAGKAIMDVPILLFQPFLTFILVGIVWIIWIYTAFWIESAGIELQSDGGIHIYRQNAAMRFTKWYNHFMMLWMVQFIYGCQHMIIGGAMSAWYFTRNKRYLNNAVLLSYKNTFKYHLGTVSMGSLIIVLIRMIRKLLRVFRKFIILIKCVLCLCCLHNKVDTCMQWLEEFMQYFNKNAYIITSIHGFDFYQSGARAFKLILENALQVIAINSIGDFVLFLAKAIIVGGTLGCAHFILQNKVNPENEVAPLVVIGVVALLIAHCCMAVYEMTVDTIFVCFCEDCEINDGVSRPYYMSKGLMEFVENSKKVFGILIVTEVNDTPQPPPYRP